MLRGKIKITFFISLSILTFCTRSSAQWDTAHYLDGAKQKYYPLMYSGYNMPAFWTSFSLLQVDIMGVTKRSSVFVLGAHHAPYQHISTMYVEYGHTLFNSRAPRKSGKVQVGSAEESYATKIYYVLFDGIESVTRYGLHVGVQRNHYSGERYGTRIRGSGGTFQCKLLATTELDIGLQVLSRRGVLIDNGSANYGRFFMMRMCLDAVIYRISQFEVYQSGPPGSNTGSFIKYDYNESDSQGMWTFADLPYENIGMKMNFEFFWSGSSPKNNLKQMKGYHVRVGMQYVPESVLGNMLLTTSFGIALGSEPRLTLERRWTNYIPTPTVSSGSKKRKG